MTRKNYPYLFGNDPEIAAIQLFKELKDCNEEHERASLLHLLTYISDPKSIERYLMLEGNPFLIILMQELRSGALTNTTTTQTLGQPLLRLKTKINSVLIA